MNFQFSAIYLFLCSKIRVDPLKTLTILRLEPCAALILAELIVVNNVDLKFDNVFIILIQISRLQG